MRPDAMDWARLDPRTGLAFADARWAIVTEPTKSTNGQDSILYVKSTGVSAPSYEDGTFVLHLRLVIETGVSRIFFRFFRGRFDEQIRQLEQVIEFD